MNCCVKFPLNIGCFSVCDELVTGLTATVAGIHTASFSANKINVEIKKTFLVGEVLRFPLTGLNEKTAYLMTLQLPNGTTINPNLTNDGWFFQTVLIKSITV